MEHGLLDSQPLARVEHHKPTNQVRSVGVHLSQSFRKATINRVMALAPLEKYIRIGHLEGFDILLRVLSKEPVDAFDHVEGGLAGEHGLDGEHFVEEAADGPHVRGVGVVLGAEEDLRGPVPAGGHLAGENGLLILVVLKGAHQPEVTKLDLATAVDQHVRGLDVTVDQLGRVQVPERAQDLVGDELVVH